jgi:uncharacterized membrane protein
MRYFEEDPRFGLITLIANDALSAVNDPGTAIQIIRVTLDCFRYIILKGRRTSRRNMYTNSSTRISHY